jgi:engulfment/cell motility protein 1
MMLINSLLSNADDDRWEAFIDELERLNVRKAVVVRLFLLYFLPQTLKWFAQRLMSSHTIEDLTSSILDFQANMIRVTYRRKTHFVDPIREPSHLAALEYIWRASKLMGEQQSDVPYKWRKLGFLTEDISQEFAEVGVLGLDCLV